MLCWSSREEIPHVRGQGQQPRVPGCDSTGTAERSYSTSKVRASGWEELPPAQGQGQWPGATIRRPRPGTVARRSNPTSKERWLLRRRRA